MKITYKQASYEDIPQIYEFCRSLILEYEQLDSIDLPKVLDWVRNKIETSIEKYTVIYADSKKAGYYHFYQNEDGQFEVDDLYIFPEFQNQGIGSTVMKKCCASADSPVILYVFIKNSRAVSLYERLGFKKIETLRGSRYIMKWENTPN